MLVLSRHEDESVVITDTVTGERIKVMCVEIRGDKVRLGFEASQRFAIHRLEIQELYARYAWTIDSGDAEGWANTFTADGVFNNSSRGHDALVQFVHDWRANRKGADRRHWYTNLILTPAAGGARGAVYMMLLDVGTRPPAPVNSYRYDDVLVKTPGGWRFQSRTLKSDLPPAASTQGR